MTEDFLHFIWKFNLFDRQNLLSDTGEPIEIISLGIHNKDAGPDFLASKIRIGSTLWVGNVEIHVNSSHWIQHKHHLNKVYDNVILHVVYHNDQTIMRNNGERIPTLALTFPKSMYERFIELMSNRQTILCHSCVAGIDSFRMQHWLIRLSTERLERKTEDIRQLLEQTINDWDSTFYIYLCRYLGFKINALPFEMLAQRLPIKLIKKYSHSQKSIEALLFGQAGFLDCPPLDSYHASLKDEYKHLRAKHELNPLDVSLWKFARLRPGNFPCLRIAQLAVLLSSNADLAESVLKINTAKQYTRIFDVAASRYWDTHYTFGKESGTSGSKRLGKKSAERILSNVIAPVLLEYGKYKNDEALQEHAFLLLEELPPEQNSIIDEWTKLGIVPQNTLDSQALIQLRNNYCEQKQCLRCPIGKHVIETSIMKNK